MLPPRALPWPPMDLVSELMTRLALTVTGANAQLQSYIGLYGDAALTVAVGEISEDKRRLIDVTKHLLDNRHD